MTAIDIVNHPDASFARMLAMESARMLLEGAFPCHGHREHQRIQGRMIKTFANESARGQHDYKSTERTAYPSPIVNAMIVEHSKNLGLERRMIGDDEIVERLVFALVNEGALILEEGIASKASDIDMVYLNGYGFPASRGGPMLHADQVGLYNVVRAIRRYARGYHGHAWEVAPLLQRRADAGTTFND